MHERKNKNADQREKPEFENKWKEHLESREKEKEKTDKSINSSGRWQTEKNATKIKRHTKLNQAQTNSLQRESHLYIREKAIVRKTMGKT